MIAFKVIRARAVKRKGGEAALALLLPKVPSQKGLARLADEAQEVLPGAPTETHTALGQQLEQANLIAGRPGG